MRNCDDDSNVHGVRMSKVTDVEEEEVDMSGNWEKGKFGESFPWFLFFDAVISILCGYLLDFYLLSVLLWIIFL